jgi:hypothetical protein
MWIHPWIVGCSLFVWIGMRRATRKPGVGASVGAVRMSLGCVVEANTRCVGAS